MVIYYKHAHVKAPLKFKPPNQLLTHGTGPTRIAGTIDEPGTVTINGIDANMRNQTEFESYLDLPPGPHQIDIAATDHNENTATQSYEITIANEPVEHLEYDLNGNLVERTGPNGTTTYGWYAFDRLIAIHYPDDTSSHFTYDGLSRRVAITEKDEHDNITQERKFLWHGLTIAEERSGTTGATVEKRFYHNGVELVTGPNAGLYTYRTDHLGSIREVVGASVSLIARYDYDAWGVPELVSGTFDLDFKYTGHLYHIPSTLHLAPFRAYDAALGRWISRDPIEEFTHDGSNLYSYTSNNPINRFDILGFISTTHFNNGVFRVDTEVPGRGGGSLHIQINKTNQKFDFHTSTGQFTCRETGQALPKKIQNEIKKNVRLQRSIENGINRVNQQGNGFANKFGGGMGRFIPMIAAIGLVIGIDEAQGDMAAYLDGVNRGRQLEADFAAEKISRHAGPLRNQLFHELSKAAEEAGCR